MTLSTYGGPLTLLADIEGYRSAAGTLTYAIGYGSRARGTLTTEGSPTEATVVLTRSDTGYRTRSSDAGGVKSYTPLLLDGLAFDRRIQLDPGRSWAAVGWGELRIRLDPAAASVLEDYTSDGRNVMLRLIRKSWDRSRGLWLDPSITEAETLFQGLAGPWRLNEFDLVVPLRDSSYWTERPAQQNTYNGTGSYDGTVDLKGRPKPRVRGGSSGNPVRNIRPVLVDPANLIYQYTDSVGAVVSLYEGAYSGYTFQADTTDLYAGSTSAGQYRTDNSRGLFQLGTSPVREITVDATGSFPVAGLINTLPNLIRYTLTEDFALPSDLIDTSAFTSLNSSFPYVAGYSISPQESPSGSEIAGYLGASMATYLITYRDGKIRPWAMRALTGAETPALTLDSSVIVNMREATMQAPLDPPPYRWRVGYQRNHYVQSNDLSPLATDAKKQTVGEQMPMEVVANSAISAKYRRPSDPEPVGGALLVQANAATVASALSSLLSAEAKLYSVEVPLAWAIAADLGKVVFITYPVERFRSGRLTQVVGESVRTGSGTAVLEVFG